MSQTAFPTHLRDHEGKEVRLAPKPFAIGGEGAIFYVQHRPDLVAKLYSKPQSKERCDKLRAMAKLCSPELLKIAAWPTTTLHKSNPSTIDGILMPRIMGYYEIHHLYSVAQRKKDFPNADWGFLLHTARNCAMAFETIHHHGHVVGDVNQKNVMVSQKGLVAFVDCDSFQVTEGARVFRCPVGVPEYTPAELHGKNFASLDRAANHDLFGLAVLVFHLLMMGRHPFSGVPLVKADIPIEKAIQEGYYAYTRNIASARLKPPPHVPPLSMLDPSVLDLFDRAFNNTRRPTASEWRMTLDTATKQLVRCKSDPKHSYLPIAGKCPWCDLIANARLMFFLPGQSTTVTSFKPEDLQQLVHKLAQLDMRLTPYLRPRSFASIRVSLPPGLRAPNPRPALKPIPLPPVYPPTPQLSPSDPFLMRVCVVGTIAGAGILTIALPVGIVMMATFFIWWVLLQVTEKWRRNRLRAELEAAHEQECEYMDEEYRQRCHSIESENQRLASGWEAANSVWVAEEKKWLQKSAEVETRFVQLETQFFAQSTERLEQFKKRKKQAEDLVSTHNKTKQEYEKELKEAQANSQKIQLEEHLDKFLIRDAKLKAITNDRVLSLESFGIQTASDVLMLRTQKVPGIGPVLSNRLFAWRDGLTASFTPKQILPDAEKKRIAGRYAPVLVPLSEAIRATIQDLEVIIRTHQTCERESQSSLTMIAENAAFIEAHLNALNNLP